MTATLNTTEPAPVTGVPGPVPTAAPAAPELVMADPAALLVDANIRLAVDLDKDFLESITEHGVLVPIVAVRTSEGALRVRYGNRRTLAAAKASLAQVPVVVVHESDADTAAARIVRQWDENERRAGLATADKVNAAEQLSAFGLSAGQIARQTKTALAEVEQALAVAGSKLATRSAQRHDFLSLDQAATLAEFEKDKPTLTALLAAAETGSGHFEHIAQRARDQRAEAEQRVRSLAELKQAGIPLIDPPGYNDRAIKTLAELRGSEPGSSLSVRDHASCPGHVAYIGTGGHAAYACTAWRKQGHTDRYSNRPANPAPTDLAGQEKARAERRTVIENNKSWRSAEKVRRAWLREFLTRKTAPKGTAIFVATELAHASHQLGQALEHSGAGMLHQLLGVADKAALLAATAKATEARAQVLSLAFVLAAYEARTDVHTWPRADPGMARYFSYLATNGYTLADVEQLVTGKPNRAARSAAKPAKTTPPIKPAAAPAATAPAAGDQAEAGR